MLETLYGGASDVPPISRVITRFFLSNSQGHQTGRVVLKDFYSKLAKLLKAFREENLG
jgi:hypothetical protein